jgi:hypothetical protein
LPTQAPEIKALFSLGMNRPESSATGTNLNFCEVIPAIQRAKEPRMKKAARQGGLSSNGL